MDLGDLDKKIRRIPDFPRKGILFYDITTLLADPCAFRFVVKKFVDHYKHKKVNAITSMEARGFIFGGALAYELGVGFIPMRKPGKLPWKKARIEYELEYGKDAVEVHEDALEPGERILVVDDLLATGGTAKAAAGLIEKLGGEVAGFAFVIELAYLKGRSKLKDYDVFSLLRYEKEV